MTNPNPLKEAVEKLIEEKTECDMKDCQLCESDSERLRQFTHDLLIAVRESLPEEKEIPDGAAYKGWTPYDIQDADGFNACRAEMEKTLSEYIQGV